MWTINAAANATTANATATAAKCHHHHRPPPPPPRGSCSRPHVLRADQYGMAG